ncbi:DUF3800 domain-containing protein [Vibrio sp.]|uniref:DUF3800 domain-containing protein n=1 Tax=Vibrio sp. TaxID=678 RepID=UPI00193EB6FA|nr:DUF3800 domain-containing protein [Vibrio parahaemolyticus]EHH1227708.1 DUF3800 domain-containing protein [Vibrio vulnificus]EGR2733495.1 DUF3800 domain-containing protein [Vibrio parahaemolyticus]EGR2885318.1 DUF3800 domain-containing protein [Vibrio parahaemolyticus]EGR3009915.1 DUF3800 domain-containing protein [Vibrio parahaemolyticus]
MTVYKIFCDESCHLERDGADVMVLGAIHCSEDKAVELTKHIKWLRHKHNYKPEFKWSRLHKHQWPLYKDLIDLVLDDPQVSFKATVIDKTKLDHKRYNAGSHNDFYYKMFYYTLRDFLAVGNNYRIYLDYMDTLGSEKTKKLCQVLQNGTHWQLSAEATIVQSYEVQLIQLCDLLIGSVAYKNRSDIERKSPIKSQFLNYIEEKLDRALTVQTKRTERNFNVFFPDLGRGHAS